MKRSMYFMLSWVLALTAPYAKADVPAPEYTPTCPAPQALTPLQGAGGGSLFGHAAVAWSGREFGVAWVDASGSGRLSFRRFFADGTADGPHSLISLSIPYLWGNPSLVWNGTEYAVAWSAMSPSGYMQIYFARISASGAPVGGSEVKASFVGQTETAHCYGPALAWSGSGYAVVWNDDRDVATGHDIYATLLDAGGNLDLSHHDLGVRKASGIQTSAAIAWFSGTGSYQVAWEDSSALYTAVHTDKLSPNGSLFGMIALPSGAWNATSPSVASTGGQVGVAWVDTRNFNEEIYFNRLGVWNTIGSALPLTNETAASRYPTILWTGSEFGVFWTDYRGGVWEPYFQRVSAIGTYPEGMIANYQVAASSDMTSPAAAFAQHGYLVSTAVNFGANFLQPWGCNYPYAPLCPESPAAYNITGTGATVAWLPVTDNYTDIAYYQVYRNGNLAGLTADTYFPDTGLSPGVTYQYSLRAVNAAQYASSGCGTGSTVYVKTNASLLLTMAKNASNAELDWTDGGLSAYKVFRGTSPQVMSQIGATLDRTYQDPNVLMDGNIYFYSVDDPGQ